VTAEAATGAAIDVREVTSADVPAVIALVSTTLAEFGLTFGVGSPTDDQLRTLPASYADAGGRFWVAADGGTLVGTCGVIPIAPATFELRKMYLRPAARGARLGVRFLDIALDWARAQGGERMVLDTMEAMTRAIAFYEAHGFVRDDSWIRGARCTRAYVRAL
jgi:GNAT superfamily N-acetyltransferase